MKKFKEIFKEYVIPCAIIAVIALTVLFGAAALAEVFR